MFGAFGSGEDVRVAFVTFEYPPHLVGGAGTYASQVVGELAKRGIQLDVFTPARDDYRTPAGVRIKGVPVDPRKPFTALQFWLGLPDVFREAEREEGYDVVHFNGTCYWFANRLTASPTVVTIHHLARDSLAHDRGVGVLLSLVERRAMSMADRVVAVSGFTKDRIVERYGLDPAKVGVVYNGGSHGPASPVDLEGARRLLAPFNGKKVVLFVGRVNDRRKGLDVLVRAMGKVVDQADAVLVVAGQGDPAGARELAASLGLDDRIAFIGYVDDPVLLGLYRLSDVYVCPSRLEGFGMTVLDAQDHAPRVVASRVGAIPEIATRSTTLVEPEDVEGLASAIVAAISGPPGCPGPSSGGRFTWGRAASDLLDEYDRVRKGPTRTR